MKKNIVVALAAACSTVMYANMPYQVSGYAPQQMQYVSQPPQAMYQLPVQTTHMGQPVVQEELYLVGHHLQNYCEPAGWLTGKCASVGSGALGAILIALALAEEQRASDARSKRSGVSGSEGHDKSAAERKMIIQSCIGGGLFLIGVGALIGKAIKATYRWAKSSGLPHWRIDLRMISDESLEQILYGQAVGFKMQVHEARRLAKQYECAAPVQTWPTVTAQKEKAAPTNEEPATEKDQIKKMLKKELKREREKAALIEREKELARISANAQVAAVR